MDESTCPGGAPGLEYWARGKGPRCLHFQAANVFAEPCDDVGLTGQIRIARHGGTLTHCSATELDDLVDVLIGHARLPGSVAEVRGLRRKTRGSRAIATSLSAMARGTARGEDLLGLASRSLRQRRHLFCAPTRCETHDNTQRQACPRQALAQTLHLKPRFRACLEHEAGQPVRPGSAPGRLAGTLATEPKEQPSCASVAGAEVSASRRPWGARHALRSSWQPARSVVRQTCAGRGEPDAGLLAATSQGGAAPRRRCARCHWRRGSTQRRGHR